MVQASAAGALWNLAANEHNKFSIAQAGAIQPLVLCVWYCVCFWYCVCVSIAQAAAFQPLVLCVYIYTHINICTQPYICINIHIYTSTHSHIHIYTYV